MLVVLFMSSRLVSFSKLTALSSASILDGDKRSRDRAQRERQKSGGLHSCDTKRMTVAVKAVGYDEGLDGGWRRERDQNKRNRKA